MAIFSGIYNLVIDKTLSPLWQITNAVWQIFTVVNDQNIDQIIYPFGHDVARFEKVNRLEGGRDTTIDLSEARVRIPTEHNNYLGFVFCGLNLFETKFVEIIKNKHKRGTRKARTFSKKFPD